VKKTIWNEKKVESTKTVDQQEGMELWSMDAMSLFVFTFYVVIFVWRGGGINQMLRKTKVSKSWNY